MFQKAKVSREAKSVKNQATGLKRISRSNKSGKNLVKG